MQGVLYCNKLFEYERTYKEKGLSFKQIHNRRLKDQKPVIEGFLAWIKQVNPGSNGKLKKAVTYIKNREDFLMTYLEDDRCSLSNNLSENSIRPVTVGRKNWLFSDTPDGASANALYLTIVEMAKAYGLNLYEYLKYLLEHRPNRDMADDKLAKLAPWNEDVPKKCCKKTSKMLAYRNPSKRVPICFEDTLKLCAYIVQAIMEKQEIVILDEPYNALDYQTNMELTSLLLKLKDEGRTILLTSHQQAYLHRLCDRIYCIDANSVIEFNGEVKERYFGAFGV